MKAEYEYENMMESLASFHITHLCSYVLHVSDMVAALLYDGRCDVLA
jgi:hypothetical protein